MFLWMYRLVSQLVTKQRYDDHEIFTNAVRLIPCSAAPPTWLCVYLRSSQIRKSMADVEADVFVCGLLDEVHVRPTKRFSQRKSRCVSFAILQSLFRSSIGSSATQQFRRGSLRMPGDVVCGNMPFTSAVRSQVAYILNLRGNDVAHSPVAIAYLLITAEGAKVFIDQDKVSTDVEAEMKVTT